jgi:hypothetical protein
MNSDKAGQAEGKKYLAALTIGIQRQMTLEPLPEVTDAILGKGTGSWQNGEVTIDATTSPGGALQCVVFYESGTQPPISQC